MIRKRILFLAAAVAIGTASMAAEPAMLEASECDGGGGQLCQQSEYCWNVLFAKLCVSQFKYYETDCLYCHDRGL